MKWFQSKPSKMWILPGDKPLKFGDEKSVLDVALHNKIDIGHTCEGMGSCTTCRVFIVEGEASPRTEIEKERAEERGFASNERLACQLVPSENLKVQIPENN